MKTVEFLGLKCVELSNGSLTLFVTKSVGPRVISLTVDGGENIFAELPNETLPCPGVGDFHLYGGHRLWHAPEDPRRTYLPDDDPVEITPIQNGLRVVRETETKTGIQKQIDIQINPNQNQVIVNHQLTNHSLWPVTCAPWAITQVRPGGVAILPQNRQLWDQNPTLPNRTLTLWPYADINSPHIEWGNDVVLIHANMTADHLKIGFPNPRSWLAYWVDGTLFVKRARFDLQSEYYDFGSSSECYCKNIFLELETLGPKVTLNPEESTTHLETWEVYTGIDWPDDVSEIVQFIES